jgi:VIT1/CCC1 family predicted Fe2+/Mn2+ transporter
MDNNKFNKFYSKKSVSDLIGQLRQHRITGTSMDKEWYEALKTHLSERDLTEETRKIVDHILLADPDILRTEEKEEEKLKATETNNQSISFGSERYPALRTIADFYTALAWLVGIVAVIIAVYFGTTEEAVLIAVATLVVGALIVLGVLAVSESIKVVIDIEYNTRQTANKK